MSRPSAGARLSRAFMLQLVLISLTTVLGVLVTYWIVEDLLSREALQKEAAYFWQRHAQNPQAALPNTANLRAYLSVQGDMSQVPLALQRLSPGYGRVDLSGTRPLTLVSDQGNARLYLAFAQQQVSDLAFYFGLVPLILVLLVIYVLAFLTYRSSKRAISPFIGLANYLEAFDFSSGARIDVTNFKQPGDSEINSLVGAVTHIAHGWEDALQRERVFTRDASHELRTPVAVFKGTLDLLEQTQDRPAHELQALQRMRRMANDMESLLHTLLLLAREPEPDPDAVPVSLAAVVQHQIQECAEAAERGAVQVQLIEEMPWSVAAPTQVLDIVVGNLLRNAINYSPGGHVELRVEPYRLSVHDSGQGMPADELDNVFNAFFRGEVGRKTASGHGLGLAIVKRIVDRYGWRVKVSSAVGEGSQFQVDFAAQSESRAAAR